MDLHKAFPQLDARLIYNELSDHCPVEARFRFPAAI
jgi:hypothetical protein